MLLGADVSYAQQNIDYSLLSKSTNFVIIKATQGRNIVDPWFINNRNGARNTDMTRGFYHYACPDKGNQPEDEANWFSQHVSDLQQGELLALDYEASWNGDVVQWCSRFLTQITKNFNGYMPLIYLNRGLTLKYNWQPVSAYYPLWLADWDNNPIIQTINGWKVPMKQYSDSGYLNGIRSVVDMDSAVPDLKPYGYKYQPPVEPVDPVADFKNKIKVQNDQVINASNEINKLIS